MATWTTLVVTITSKVKGTFNLFNAFFFFCVLSFQISNPLPESQTIDPWTWPGKWKTLKMNFLVVTNKLIYRLANLSSITVNCSSGGRIGASLRSKRTMHHKTTPINSTRWRLITCGWRQSIRSMLRPKDRIRSKRLVVGLTWMEIFWRMMIRLRDRRLSYRRKGVSRLWFDSIQNFFFSRQLLPNSLRPCNDLPTRHVRNRSRNGSILWW